jgi:predicted kinase
MSVAVTAGSHSSSSSTSFFNCRSDFIAQLLKMNRGVVHKNKASTRNRVSGLIQINRPHLRRILLTGNSVIVDATFLGHAHRSAFFAMASRFGVPARILDFRAAPSVLAARIAARSHVPRDASDADLSTLRLQVASADLLTCEERLLTFPFDTAVPLATFSCTGFWQPVIDFMQPEIEQTAQVQAAQVQKRK